MITHRATLHRTRKSLAVYDEDMATNGTLLCIHRDPGQLSLLQDHGYDLVTATNGHEGLRPFMTQSEVWRDIRSGKIQL